eukprot:scaffold2619_cov129-Skeletonema_dohrnii-CCMP3373.AAC.4
MPSRRWFSNHSRPPPNFRALLAQLCYGRQTVCVLYWMYEIHTTSYVVACISARVKCKNITAPPGTGGRRIEIYHVDVYDSIRINATPDVQISGATGMEQLSQNWVDQRESEINRV